MRVRTEFQTHLRQRTLPWRTVTEYLGCDRTLPSHWASGRLFPNRPNATLIIQLFAEHGVFMDYNTIYKSLDE